MAAAMAAAVTAAGAGTAAKAADEAAEAAKAVAADRATVTPLAATPGSPDARMETDPPLTDPAPPTMADRPPHIPTQKELEEVEARLVNLVNVTIPTRRQKGRGRLKRDETTRNRFVLTYALGAVRDGKLLSREDMRFLFMPAVH